jgi:sugar lactone lactonase YvrE
MVAQGLTNREIAAKLFISERTADGHLEHIREKLGVNSRAQVSAWVVRHEAMPIAAPALPARTPRASPALLAHPRAWLATTLVLAVLAGGVGVLRLTAPPLPMILTVAGSQCAKQIYPGGCYGGDNQSALGAQLARPTSIAIDSKGIMYVADYQNSRIRKVAGGVISTVAGGATDDLADGKLGISVSLGYASAVAIDSQDQLHLLTSRDDILEVWRIDANGFMHFVVSLGPSNVVVTLGGFNLAVGGLAISKQGVLFIADRAGNRVMRYDGNLSTYAGTGDRLGDGGAAASAQLSWPIGLALDKSENLYIADTGNHRIRKVDHVKGTITTVAGGAGEFEGSSGDEGPAIQARLSFPFDVAVAPDGTFVFTDTGNHRLRAVTPDGKIHALAGTGRWGFSGDGAPALQAEFDGPEGLVLDSKGNLFIADTENQRIRVISRLFGSGL